MATAADELILYDWRRFEELLGTRLGGFCWRLDEVFVMFDGLLFRFLPAIEAVAG